jgi:hypothetical protein
MVFMALYVSLCSSEGRKRCGIAKTVHGGETTAIRAARPAKMAELKVLEKIIEKW